MNLYLRFLILIFKIFFAKKSLPLEASCLKFLVWPWDCDFNLHTTNSRYLSFMDLGRVYLLGAMGVTTKLLKLKWFPVLHACEVSFLKPLRPFTRFELITRIVSWDEKFFYIEQRFMCKGKLCALGLVRGLFLHQREKISPQAVVDLSGHQIQPPEASRMIQLWEQLIAAQKDME